MAEKKELSEISDVNHFVNALKFVFSGVPDENDEEKRRAHAVQKQAEADERAAAGVE